MRSSEVNTGACEQVDWMVNGAGLVPGLLQGQETVEEGVTGLWGRD